MWPGLPTSLSGAYVIESAIDEACQANLVTRLGKPFGCWLDDSTPNLNHWLELAVAKYKPLGQTVFVCVPPGEPNLRHSPSPPVVNVYEIYHFGMGCPPSEWGPVPARTAYCIQWAWPGTHGKAAPTEVQRQSVLDQALAHRPKFVFLF